MGPTKILRSLSFLRSPMRSSTVVPFSTQSSFKGLKLSSPREKVHDVTAVDLRDKVADLVTSLKRVSDPNKFDRVRIEEYLEEGIELLDICNFLLNKIESVKSYSESVKRAVRRMGCTHVKELLNTKKYRGDDVSVEKCLGRLKRMQRRRSGEDDSFTRPLTDVVTALSFKKGRRSCGGGCMVELRDVIGLAKRIGDPTAEVDEEDVKKNCDVLADAMGPLEDKVKELYKELVGMRMVLLGIVSYH